MKLIPPSKITPEWIVHTSREVAENCNGCPAEFEAIWHQELLGAIRVSTSSPEEAAEILTLMMVRIFVHLGMSYRKIQNLKKHGYLKKL